jgi:hypothetical protein
MLSFQVLSEFSFMSADKEGMCACMGWIKPFHWYFEKPSQDFSTLHSVHCLLVLGCLAVFPFSTVTAGGHLLESEEGASILGHLPFSFLVLGFC